jgi:hypothetical protein
VDKVVLSTIAAALSVVGISLTLLLLLSTMASHPDTKVDCSKVYIKKSSFSNEKTGEFDGAFAAVPIKKGASVFGLVVVSMAAIFTYLHHALQC